MNPTDTAPDSLPTPQAQRTDLSQLTDTELVSMVGKSWINFKETATAVLLEYHRRGRTPADLGRDLAAAGWPGSPRTIRALATDLRQQGILEPAKQGKRGDLDKEVAGSATSTVTAPEEKIHRASLATVTDEHENAQLTQILSGPEGPRPHTPVYLSVGNKGDEAYRELVHHGKDLTGDERLSLRCLFGGCLEETGIPRQATHEFLSQHEDREVTAPPAAEPETHRASQATITTEPAEHAVTTMNPVDSILSEVLSSINLEPNSPGFNDAMNKIGELFTYLSPLTRNDQFTLEEWRSIVLAIGTVQELAETRRQGHERRASRHPEVNG